MAELILPAHLRGSNNGNSDNERKEIITRIMKQIGAEEHLSEEGFLYYIYTYESGQSLCVVPEYVEGYPIIEYFFLKPDFAKVFFGEKLCTAKRIYGENSPMLYKNSDPQVAFYCNSQNIFKAENHQFRMWEYHLQQMVLEEDRFQYLKRFLKNEQT